MPRNTLEWEKCDHCGRRIATSDCMIGGRTYRLCPYCAIALASLGITECRRAVITLPRPSTGLGKSMSRVESLIEGIGEVPRTARARSKAQRARRRSGYRRK